MATDGLILASGSPRRRQILADHGYAYTVDVAGIAEDPREGEAPADLAIRLALAKATAVAARHDDGYVLGADTVVALDGVAYGKPADAQDACAILRALRGREHRVLTGVAVVRAADGAAATALSEARVTMRSYTDDELWAYIETGEPMDKAGAYGAQGRARALIERIDGSLLTVIGLPIDAVRDLLARLGYKP